MLPRSVALFGPWMAIVCVLGLGCGGAGAGTPPDLVSARGTQLYFQGLSTGFTQHTVDAMEAQLADGLVANGWDSARLPGWFRGAQVYFIQKNFACAEDSKAQCAGEQEGDVLEVSLQPGDPWATAYRHELAHRLQAQRGLDDRGYAYSYDPGHQDHRVWSVVSASTPESDNEGSR